MDKTEILQLIKKASEAARSAYAPYSKFCVGAAVKTDKGVFCGFNVENASYSATVCAERTAVYNALLSGAKMFYAVAVSARDKTFCMPCGICRQVLAEFCGKDFIIIAGGEDDYKTFTLDELLPHAFKL
jgi:cytidine deaminase